MTTYDLRRYACTRIVEACAGNFAKAMIFTGHTKKETLLRYVQATERDAAEVAPRIGWSAPALRLVEAADDTEDPS